MERLHNEFKAAMIEINGRLNMVQLQVNHLWSYAFVNHDASTSTMPASTLHVPVSSLISNTVVDPLNDNLIHSPFPNNPTQTHTSLVHNLLFGGTFNSFQNLIVINQCHL